MTLDELRRLFQPKEPTKPKPKHDPSLPCEGFHGECRRTPTESIPAATAYHWNGEGENPNRDVVLCAECAEAYAEHWSEMWREYRSGLI